MERMRRELNAAAAAAAGEGLFDPGPALDSSPGNARRGARAALMEAISRAGRSPRPPSPAELADLEGCPALDAVVDAPGGTLYLVAVGRTEKNDRPGASWRLEGPRGDGLLRLRQRLSERGELLLACWGPSLDEPLAVSPLDLEETRHGHNRHWTVAARRPRPLSAALR